jgi:hypothetical protein
MREIEKKKSKGIVYTHVDKIYIDTKNNLSKKNFWFNNYISRREGEKDRGRGKKETERKKLLVRETDYRSICLP